MDYLCCPACHGVLEEGTKVAPHLTCTGCGAVFPSTIGVTDFVDSTTLDDFARWQHGLYDGEEGPRDVPDYAEPEAVRRHTDHCLGVAREHGLLMPTWLGVRCREVTDTLGPREGEWLLDVGCSVGTVLNSMNAVYGIRGVGVDFSGAAIKAASAYNPCGNEYYVADAMRLPVMDAAFDLAVSYGVIEHVSDPEQMVREMVRILKPGGRMLIYTPCRNDAWSWHWWQRVTSGERYDLGVENLWGHDREKFLSPPQLTSYLEGVGLDRVDTVAVHTLYTLMFDEMFPNAVFRLLARPRAFGAVRRILELADALPNDRGYGNEFLAVGWKPRED